MRITPLTPVIHGKNGPLFSANRVMQGMVTAIACDNFFHERYSPMRKDLDQASTEITQMTEVMTRAMGRLVDAETNLTDKTKQATGRVRDASEKLASGIAKIEKIADFDRLERMVQMLERAATAMTVLADLESKGKLDRIAAAIR